MDADADTTQKAEKPMCPEKKDLMNYVLGREVDQKIRSHIHVCKGCRRETARLEDGLLAEALEREIATFRPLSVRNGKK